MKHIACLLLFVFAVGICGSSLADDEVTVTGAKDRFGPRRGVRGSIGIKAGVFSKGDFDAHDPYTTDIGATAQVFADFPVSSRNYLGMAFDFHNIKILRSNAVMVDISLVGKHSFPIKGNDVIIQPAAGIGIGALAQFNEFDESRYLTTKLSVEALFKYRRREMWILEVGIFRAPLGRSDAVDIVIGPMFFARVGYGYR
ncbi:MAG: hypothetical protein KKA42_14055 [candidate division Zixibacteria bacterium]|nr:hypothetical protein [candidate division Zixibacteria bacterium]